MSLRVAYIVSSFPKLSETFIVDEIRALERQQVAVEIYSVPRGRPSLTHPEAAELADRAHSFGLASPRWLGAQLYWLRRSPRALARIWAHTLASHVRSPRYLARALVAVAHAAAFAMTIERSGVRHVHAHWATHTAIAAWAIHRLTGLPYSFTAHADDIFVPRPMLADKLRESAFVVTISAYNRRFLCEQLGDWADEKIRVVHCGVETDAFQAFPLSASPPLVIACVARLEPKKGHRHLLDACARLDARGVDFRCLLVGEGSERAALERQCRELELGDRVRLLGAMPRERVREVLAEANAVALPCIVAPNGRADGIPVALMEAMAMERPVVASSVSGVPELVEHERSGLLAPPGDPDALADALERLHGDRTLALALGAEGRLRVLKDFDLEQTTAALRALFASSAAGAERNPGKEVIR
jgi:colanic acid/amylovoran biosynthesis glycosyltransferase